MTLTLIFIVVVYTYIAYGMPASPIAPFVSPFLTIPLLMPNTAFMWHSGVVFMCNSRVIHGVKVRDESSEIKEDAVHHHPSRQIITSRANAISARVQGSYPTSCSAHS